MDKDIVRLYRDIQNFNYYRGGNNSNNIGIKYRGKMYATLYSNIKKINSFNCGEDLIVFNY